MNCRSIEILNFTNIRDFTVCSDSFMRHNLFKPEPRYSCTDENKCVDVIFTGI